MCWSCLLYYGSILILWQKQCYRYMFSMCISGSWLATGSWMEWHSYLLSSFIFAHEGNLSHINLLYLIAHFSTRVQNTRENVYKDALPSTFLNRTQKLLLGSAPWHSVLKPLLHQHHSKISGGSWTGTDHACQKSRVSALGGALLMCVNKVPSKYTRKFLQVLYTIRKLVISKYTWKVLPMLNVL
jgi:hypothetical protein